MNKKFANKNDLRTASRGKSFKVAPDYNFRHLFIILVLFFTCIIFSKSINNNFVNWDDDVYITDNNYIKDLSLNGIRNIFHSYVNDELPVTHLSLAIDYHFWKLNPKPYHTVNLIYHLLNILLVYYFILLLCKKPGIALITSLLFAVHPFRVESVAWAAERKDVLFTFFYLLALISYCHYITKDYKLKYLVFTFFLSILSLLSKFSAVSLPVTLVLLDYYFSRKTTMRTILEKLPFLIFPVISFLIHFYISNQPYLNNSLLISKFSFFHRIFFAGYAMFYYLVNFVFPYKLSAIHPFPPKTSFLPYQYYIFTISVLIIAFIIIRSIYSALNFKKILIFGFMFFSSTIFLVLHLVPFGGWVIVAERYTYLPYIGLSFLSAQLIFYLYESKSFTKKKVYLNIVFLAFISYYSIMTYNRCKVWNNSILLFTDVINKYPDVSLAYDNRAEAKGRIMDYEGAIEDCNLAIKNQPDFSNAYCNRGNAKGMLKNYKGAIEDFSFALTLSPKDGVIYFNRGVTKNILQDYNGAIDDYNMAVKLKKNYLEGYYNRGLTKNSIKDYYGAINDFTTAAGIDPNFTEAYRNRANAKFNLHDYQGAINDIDIVLHNNPNDASLFYNRAISKIFLKRTGEACIDLSMASQLGSLQANDLIRQYCR